MSAPGAGPLVAEVRKRLEYHKSMVASFTKSNMPNGRAEAATAVKFYRDLLDVLESAITGAAPIAMLLYCPRCALQHVDKADEPRECAASGAGCNIGPHGPNGEQQCSYCGEPPEWDNPPHRTHLCAGCGYRWRPSDRFTQGVASIETHGKDDQPAQPIGAMPQLIRTLRRQCDEHDATLTAIAVRISDYGHGVPSASGLGLINDAGILAAVDVLIARLKLAEEAAEGEMPNLSVLLTKPGKSEAAYRILHAIRSGKWSKPCTCGRWPSGDCEGCDEGASTL